MNKFLTRVTLVITVLLTYGSLFAGSLDYLSNQSGKYIMTFSRNGASDSAADLANYNPAATAFFKPGLYLDASLQTLFKPYEETGDFKFKLPTVYEKDKTFKQDETSYIPNFYAVYNFGQVGMGNLAAYLQAGIVAGGGTVKWNDGDNASSILLGSLGAYGWNFPTSQSFEASSVYYGIGVGVAYSFNSMISASIGGRAVIAKRSITIDAVYSTATLYGKYDYDAVGFTPIICVDIKPMENLNLSVRYEHETNLKFKYNKKDLTSSNGTLLGYATGMLANLHIADGEKFNYNLPSILALGAEYVANKDLAFQLSANIFFMGQCNLGKAYDATKSVGTAGNEVGDENKYFETGYEVALGTTYKVIPELKIGAGIMYTRSGAKKSYFENSYTILHASANPALDSWTFGLGGTYTIGNTGVDVTLAAAWVHYVPVSFDYTAGTAAVNTVSGKYQKDIYVITLGVGYAM